jgi:hypothetical protein
MIVKELDQLSPEPLQVESKQQLAEDPTHSKRTAEIADEIKGINYSAFARHLNIFYW